MGLMATLSYNYSQAIFYIAVPLAIILALIILRIFAYLQSLSKVFKCVNYFYIICFSVIYFLCQDLYIDLAMNGSYFSFDDPERFDPDDALRHKFYLALILKFHLSLMLSFILFNSISFKAKALVNTLGFIWCVIRSWGFEPMDMFFDEFAVPSFLFWVEFSIWALLFTAYIKIKRKSNK